MSARVIFEKPAVNLTSHTTDFIYLESAPPPTRPHHVRRKLSKWADAPTLQNICSVLKRVFPKGWGSRASLEKLAMDFYITATGLSSAHRVQHFTLNATETMVLALELSLVADTSNLLFLIDSTTEQLFVIHTHVLLNRLDNLSSAKTIFLRKAEHGYLNCREEVHQLLAIPFAFFRAILYQSSRQVIQSSELGWSPLETNAYMSMMGNWLLEHPVIVFSPLNSNALPVFGTRQSNCCLTVRFEGSDARFDHALEKCEIPKDALRTVTQGLHGPRHEERRLSLSAIQDNIQTEMFNRLSSNESDLFADVACEVSGSEGGLDQH